MPKRRKSQPPDISCALKKEKTHHKPSAIASPDVGQSVTDEEQRLLIDRTDKTAGWKLWGPYLSERQWGTVREDYSQDGNCWEYFPHEAATYRAYRWGEDGLFGWSDTSAKLCMSLALWNGRDHILKERLFGLTGPQGNHGEDVKECYFYLEGTPTHSYNKALYKYPQTTFPYKRLVEENADRSSEQPEFELLDSGVFDNGRYWDVTAEYAKVSPCDIMCQYTVHNRGDQDAWIHVLPQVWFRNTWGDDGDQLPSIHSEGKSSARLISNTDLGDYIFEVIPVPKTKVPEMLYTDNESNTQKIDKKARVHSGTSKLSYAKDAFHEYVVKGNTGAVNRSLCGTKVAAYYKLYVKAQSAVTVRCRLRKDDGSKQQFSKVYFDDIINQRRRECDEFYHKIIPMNLSEAEKNVAKQSYAGLCFTKQYFGYHVAEWAAGRTTSLNSEWKHMLNHDIISMPDKWEFPWYATWDLAFHMVPFCVIDPEFAKQQLLLLLSERYMHPNGQLPAYEFNFSDVNPPVHAWACLQVYHTSSQSQGFKDTSFLKKAFHKLMLNFNWWVNKKDRTGGHIYHGGFLGLDNISCVHRSEPPAGTSIEQVDGTCWMAFYCVSMLQIALELAQTDDVYEDLAIKFLEHFSLIREAINKEVTGLWDNEDGFYYDRLTDDSKDTQVLKVRSLVGLSSLFAATVLPGNLCRQFPDLFAKLQLVCGSQKASKRKDDVAQKMLISVPNKEQITSMLHYMLDVDEFLSPYGIRSLSKVHTEPLSVEVDEISHSVQYCPGESNCDMFGGNSNWRGPVWFCMNYLILEALDKYNEFYGEELTVEHPQGSGSLVQLDMVSADIRRRLVSIFLPDNAGKRPVHGGHNIYATDENWKNLVLFYEYFHGDNGRGCGASHQTGWTALIVNILNKLAATGHTT